MNLLSFKAESDSRSSCRMDQLEAVRISKLIVKDLADFRQDIQEIFGSHYELPELGPVGSNGMALPRDFEIPVASFDIDQSPWESK